MLSNSNTKWQSKVLKNETLNFYISSLICKWMLVILLADEEALGNWYVVPRKDAGNTMVWKFEQQWVLKKMATKRPTYN